MKALIFMLSCACCLAQLPVVPFVTQPALLSGDWIQQNGGAFVYWNSLDLNTNWTKVGTTNQWLDRIHGVALLQTANSGAEPTNSVNTNGVHFNGSQWLDIASNFVTIKTNVGITNWSMAFIFNLDAEPTANQVLLTDTNSRYSGFGYVGFLYAHHSAPATDFFEEDEDIDQTTFALSTAARWNINTTKTHLMDCEVMAFYTGAANTYQVFTNGVSVGVNVPLLHTNLTRIGTDDTKTLGYIGYIAGLVFATNIVDPVNWASNVSNTWSNEFKFHR